MFGSIGWGEMMILLVAALVILGPDRLPGAITWVTKSIKQVKEYASGASQQLKDELGTDFDDFRQPLADLNKLRGMTPRAAITKHLLDGDDSIFTSTRDALQNGANSLKDSASLKTPSSPADIKIPAAPVAAAATAGIATDGSSTADVSLTKSDIPSTRADSDIFAEPAAPAELAAPAEPPVPSTPVAEPVSTVKPVSPGGPSAQPVSTPAASPSPYDDDAT